MPVKKTTITNKLGLHARAATKFANIANKYACQVDVTFGKKTINGKSIMSLMLLAAAKGSKIQLTTQGEDELDALNELLTLIENKFDEGE